MGVFRVLFKDVFCESLVQVGRAGEAFICLSLNRADRRGINAFS